VADTDRYLPRAAEARRESKYVEFKTEFDPSNDGEWLELLKDMVAIANGGGGVIVIGVRNDGSASGADVCPVLALDGAAICDKLASYTGDNFDDFEVSPLARDGTRVAAIVVRPAEDAPLTFEQPGTYPDPRRPDTHQKSAFGRGPYMRHGAKSEPATRDDLRAFIERRLEAIRAEWLGGIKRVITAPRGAEIVAAGLRTASRLVEPDLGAQHVLKILQLVERVAIEGLCEAHCKQGSDDSEKIEQPR
jgi:hypothetical protein